MPWKECSTMSAREEFVALAVGGQGPMAVLCRRFGIPRKTGHKWVARFRAGSTAALADRSRRPHASPTRTGPVVEAAVVGLRRAHPAWGGRKIKRRLADLGEAGGACAAATVTEVLRRHGLIEPDAARRHRPFARFEHPEPNDSWQVDFKGHVPLTSGGRCHPLTVTDDHSRYSLALRACGDERAETVRGHLVAAFRRYGLPRRIPCDNGSPWGTGGGPDHFTPLALWLLRLDVGVVHGRPRHPRTQGKAERFHATLVAGVLRWHAFDDLAAGRAAFDSWRETYNTCRPHEAIGMDVPARRYRVSPRAYPSALPDVAYPAADLTRKVSANSGVVLHGKRYGIGKAFRGRTVGLRPTAVDGVWDVFYCRHRVGGLDERTGGPMARGPADPLAALAPPAATT